MSRFGVPRIKKKDPDILEQVQFTTTTTAGAAEAHEPCLLSPKHKAGSGDIVPLSAATKWEDVEKGEPHPSQAAIMTAREATDRLEHGKISSDTGKTPHFTASVAKEWNSLSKKAVRSPSLKLFKTQPDNSPSHLI